MARVFKRGSKWGIDYAAHGRRIREIVAPNKAMAEIALKKKLVLIAENKFLEIKREQRIKFEEFADDFYQQYCKVNHRTPHKASGSSLKVLKRYFYGRYLHEIDVQSIEKFKMERGKEVCPGTVNRALTCLKSLFNRAIDWGKFDGENPVRKVKLFPENNARTRFLEKEEIARLLSKCNDCLRPIVILALNTGMRKSEILNLKWHDVDFERGIIHLTRTKNNERREVPINESVKAALIAVRKHPLSPYIFCTRNGNPFLDIRKNFNKALKVAGITEFRFHDLRHTAASQLVMAGVDLNTVREILGHKSLRMTLRYSHLSASHKKRAVEVLDSQIGTYLAHEKKEDNFPNDSVDINAITKAICGNAVSL